MTSRSAFRSGVLVGVLLLSACGGGTVAATVPDGWVVHESADLGYRMAHPADWEASVDPIGGGDVFRGADDVEIWIARYRDDDGWPADALFLGAVSDARDLYGTEPSLVNELTGPGAARIQIYASEYGEDAGRTFFFQRAVVLTPPDLWYIDWYSPVGDEGGDRQHFLEFVQSFVPAPGLADRQQG